MSAARVAGRAAFRASAVFLTVRGTVAMIPLNGGLWAMVDAADLPLVSQNLWHRHRSGQKRTWYAHGSFVNENGRTVRRPLHRVLLGATDSRKPIDHRNGNGLDNTRANLRVATNSQNSLNIFTPPTGSSRYRGVTWHKQVRKWQAACNAHGRTNYAGVFADELDAARAYDAAARRLHGEDAHLNFPDEPIAGPTDRRCE